MMKCLTIKQPWAWLIFNDVGNGKGFKNVENRTWHTKIRGTVAIHSSKKIDIDAYNGLINYSHLNLPSLNEFICGEIIGVVDIVDSVNDYPSFWKEPNSVGFILQNPKKLNETIPLKGQLGFFNLSDVHMEQIIKQIE